MTTTRYIVKYGDWMAKIADDHGSTVSEIWNHPENAEHRAKRGSPDVLYPGDVLSIPVAASEAPAAPPLLKKLDPNAPVGPDAPWPYPPFEGPFSPRPTWECPGGTCQCHPVPEDEQPEAHTIVFYDPLGKRMPGARCAVYEQGRLLTPDPTTADGVGELQFELRPGTATLRVEWAPANMPTERYLPYNKIYTVKMGDDEDAGFDRRLANLGFSNGRRREDNVRDYQGAYSREQTGNPESIRPEVLERHDDGDVRLFHPRKADDAPAAGPETKSLFGSPPERSTDASGSPDELDDGSRDFAFAPDGDPPSGGGGSGKTTATGQSARGSVVPNATNLILVIHLEPQQPIDPANVKVLLRPVAVPGLNAAELQQPIAPSVGPVKHQGAGHYSCARIVTSRWARTTHSSTSTRSRGRRRHMGSSSGTRWAKSGSS